MFTPVHSGQEVVHRTGCFTPHPCESAQLKGSAGSAALPALANVALTVTRTLPGSGWSKGRQGAVSYRTSLAVTDRPASSDAHGCGAQVRWAASAAGAAAAPRPATPARPRLGGPPAAPAPIPRTIR